MSTYAVEMISTLLVPDGGRVPVNATFRYDSDDPILIQVQFHTRLDEPIVWVFARDLLLSGVDERAGDGDVVIWPSEHSDGGDVHLQVTSPFGQAEFLFVRQEIVDFLNKTSEMIPVGSEFDHIDLDGELKSLLDGDGDLL